MTAAAGLRFLDVIGERPFTEWTGRSLENRRRFQQ
jgi:hypothetical protein